MQIETKLKIKSNPYLYKYLQENSYWYKYLNRNHSFINKIEEKVSDIVSKSLKTGYNYIDLKNQIILELSPFINDLTGRRPIILPVIMEVKDN